MSDPRQERPSREQEIFGIGRLFGWLLLGLVLWLTSCGTYQVAKREYWDWRVQQMCAAEGGIKLFLSERIRATPRFVRDGVIRLPVKIADGRVNKASWEYHKGDPYFIRISVDRIRAHDPSVWRETTEVVRATDNAVLGRSVVFGRTGSDAIAIDHESHFSCPQVADLINSVFSQ